MRVLVCGWVGSTNLGDELVFAGVRRLLRRYDATVLAVSTDPTATTRLHGVTAIDHRNVGDVLRAARTADLVVFGGGGLVQDETSPFNLPYHLSRVVPALRAGTPIVGLGLGIGPLETALGRRSARILGRLDALTVRDRASQELLAELDVPAELGADTAWHLAERHGIPATAPSNPLGPRKPRPRLEAERVVNVSLRPWSGSGASVLPVGWRRGTGQPDWVVPTLAAALDRITRRTGRRVRMVALQTDRDHQLHREIAAAMTMPAEVVVPHLGDVVSTVGTAEAVVAMRYHAGVAATMSGRPSVLIGYSPKVDALASELNSGARRLGFDRDELERLDDAVVDLLADDEAPAAVVDGRDRLVARAAVNAAALARIAATIR